MQRVELDEGHGIADLLELREGVMLALAQRDALGVREEVIVALDEPESDSDADCVRGTDNVRETVAQRVDAAEALGLRLELRVTRDVTDPLGLRLEVMLPLTLREERGVRDTLPHALAEPERVALLENELLPDREGEGEDDKVSVPGALSDGDSDSEGDGVPERLALTLALMLALPLRSPVVLNDVKGLVLPALEALAEPEPEVVREMVSVREGKRLPDMLVLAHLDDKADNDALMLALAERDAHGLAESVIIGEGDCDGDEHAVKNSDALERLLSLGVAQALRTPLDEREGVALTLTHFEGLAENEELVLVLGEPDADGDIDCRPTPVEDLEGVKQPVAAAEALGLMVSLGVAQPLAAPLGDVDGCELTLAHADALTERDTDALAREESEIDELPEGDKVIVEVFDGE